MRLTFRKAGLWQQMAVLLATAACLPSLPMPADADPRFPSSAGDLRVETVATGLDHPWGLAFLPDGRMLVTERPGRVRIVTRDGQISRPLGGIPAVLARGQGGMLDIAADRAFAQNRTFYVCFAEPGEGGGHTALARATLNDKDAAAQDVQVIFRQAGPQSSGNHYGCRIAQGTDGTLYLAMGEHFTTREEAQNLSNHLGKIVRIRPDGSVPDDNPFRSKGDARPEIFSYGHRNPQALAFHPRTGVLWEIEHGPRGGDEVNIVKPGRNYGWPVIGYGINYDGSKAHETTHKDGMEQPVKYWVPSIAPSGMAFYTADAIPQWTGSLFLGALVCKCVVRLSLDGDRITGEERLLQNLGERIRDVRAGPDGALWLLTDNAAGRVIRVTVETPRR